MILLDTHAAIWFATNSEELGTQARALARAALADDRLSLSAVSFWEIALLIFKNRLRVLASATELRDQLLDAGVTELPLTGEIGILAVNLENLHADPADRFIVATAIAHQAILVTADDRLLRWKHQLKRQNAEK